MIFWVIFIWEKAAFFFEQIFPVVARTWFPLRSVWFFLGPKSWFLAKKSDFCHTTPILVNDPFVALGEAVHFPPWDRFFDFTFQSYSCFRKKIRLTAQKVFPLLTVGATSVSNSWMNCFRLFNVCGTITCEGHLGKVLRWIEKFSLEKSEPQRTCL